MPNTAVPKTTATPARAFTAAPKSKQWRVVDYVTTAVLGIAVGLVFWVLALSWKVLELAFQAFDRSHCRALGPGRSAGRGDHPQTRCCADV